MAMTELSLGGESVNTTDLVTLTEYAQKVIVLNGSNKGVVEFVNTKLTMSALTTAPNVGSVISGGTSGAKMLIDSVSADKTTIYGFTYNYDSAQFAVSEVLTDADGNMNPSGPTTTAVSEARTTPLYHAFEVFPNAGAHSIITDGTNLADLYLGCAYRGRLVLSGNPGDPFQWYMSRQLDYTDYVYEPNNAQSPVAGANADAGKVGDIIRSLIPYHDDYLIFGCAGSLWYLQGDPAAGGSLNVLDDKQGAFGAFSHCWDEFGNLWILTTTGINRIQVGQGLSLPQNMSATRLPKLLDGVILNPSDYRVTFGYDRKRHGIMISITKVTDGTNTCYWYDTRTEGFFPETYPKQSGAYSMYYYNSTDPADSDLLIGTRDGYISHWDDTATDDDAGDDSDVAINSYVVFPVAHLSEDADTEGKLMSLTVIMSGGASSGEFTDSDAVDYSIYVADDAETLIENIKDGDTPLHTGTLTGPGRMNRIRKKARGVYMAIKFNNDTSSQTWSIENVEGDVVKVGKVK